MGSAADPDATDTAQGDSAAARLSLRLAAEHASLPRMRDAVRGWLATATPASRDERHDILLAAWEACVNAIEHPLGPLQKQIGLELRLRAGCVTVTVRDSGLWLQHGTPPREQRFGSRLIETLMDAVEVERSGDGTAVVMRRRVGASDEQRRSGREDGFRSGALSRR